jgi:hypothetical protein
MLVGDAPHRLNEARLGSGRLAAHTGPFDPPPQPIVPVFHRNVVILFYVDFTGYSIFGHFGREDEPPAARLAPERAF